jgi:hypothetical protein
MSPSIRVHLLPNDAEDAGSRVSRFRNFGEDVYRRLQGLATVDIAEVDAATDVFVVRDIRRRHLGEVTQVLARTVRANLLDGEIELARDEGGTAKTRTTDEGSAS